MARNERQALPQRPLAQQAGHSQLHEPEEMGHFWVPLHALTLSVYCVLPEALCVARQDPCAVLSNT